MIEVCNGSHVAPQVTAKTCAKCENVKPLSAFELTPLGKHRSACEECRREAKHDAALRRGLEEKEREQQRHDDLWAATQTGRSLRATTALAPQPTRSQRLKVRDSSGGGYISVAELACRCTEHEATLRATKSCRTPEDTAKAVRVLEQGLPGFDRRKALELLWRKRPATVAPETETHTGPDPFAEAFGEWAPAWVSEYGSAN